MSVKNHYQRVIRDIVQDNHIPLLPHRHPDLFKVSAGATFSEVVQHTEAFVGGRLDDEQHYRYERYWNILRNGLSAVNILEGRVTHVDIGCGAGVFSWPFLDWMTGCGIGLECINLYGFDHSPSMIRLAQEMNTRLGKVIVGYPCMHYYYDVESLLRKFMVGCQNSKLCVVTFGFVLVQVWQQDDSDEIINQFASLISQTHKMMGHYSDYKLVAVDSIQRSIAFDRAWDSLKQHLEDTGIGMDSIRRETSARIASLRPM